MYNEEKVSLTWNAPRALLPKNRVKLLLNLVTLANSGIPRGGQIAVEVTGDDAASVFVVRAQGVSARIPVHAEDLLAGRTESGGLDAHGIQPFYAGEVARAAGMTVALSLDGDVFTIRARQDAAIEDAPPAAA